MMAAMDVLQTEMVMLCVLLGGVKMIKKSQHTAQLALMDMYLKMACVRKSKHLIEAVDRIMTDVMVVLTKVKQIQLL